MHASPGHLRRVSQSAQDDSIVAMRPARSVQVERSWVDAPQLPAHPRVMTPLELAASVARLGLAVMRRRMAEGPLLPGWSWRFELCAALARDEFAGLWRLDVPARRAHVEATPIFSRALARVVSEPIDLGGVPGRSFVPRADVSGAVVLYLHGGAYEICSVHTHRELIARITRAAKSRTLAIDYRLAPEHPFPAAVDDCYAAYRALLASGVDPRQLVLAGDSAGGALALAVLLRARDAGDPLPAGAALLSPAVDLAIDGAGLSPNERYDYLTREMFRAWGTSYLGGADPHHPWAAPLHANLAGLPPLLLQVGGAELLLDPVTLFAERARAAGVDATLDVHPGMIPVWHMFATLAPECRRAIRDIGTFIRRVVDVTRTTDA